MERKTDKAIRRKKRFMEWFFGFWICFALVVFTYIKTFKEEFKKETIEKIGITFGLITVVVMLLSIIF